MRGRHRTPVGAKFAGSSCRSLLGIGRTNHPRTTRGELSMNSDRRSLSRHERIAAGSVVVVLVLVLAALVMAPATALGQATGAATSTPTVSANTTATVPANTTPTATPQAGPALQLSSSSGLPGSTVTANGSGFRPGETVTLSFNGPTVGTETADTNGKVVFTFTAPATLGPGKYGVTATGQTSNSV